jgi:hypothetical protein
MSCLRRTAVICIVYLKLLAVSQAWLTSFKKIKSISPHGSSRILQAQSQSSESLPRVLVVAQRLPVVAYSEGEVGESMMSSFYTKARARSSREAPFVARVKGLYNAMTGSASSKMIWIGWAGTYPKSPQALCACFAGTYHYPPPQA